MSSRYSPTRVVTLTITAVYDETDTLDNDELVDLGIEALAAALPEGFHYSGSAGFVVAVSHAPED
jgi:hypothetical protein